MTGVQTCALPICFPVTIQAGTEGVDTAVDGVLGPKTISTFQNYLKTRGAQASIVMHRALNCLQGEYMIAISENRQANEDFTFGWLVNRVD